MSRRDPHRGGPPREPKDYDVDYAGSTGEFDQNEYGGDLRGGGPYGSLQRQYENRFVSGGHRGSYGDFQERPPERGEVLRGGYSATAGGGYAPGRGPPRRGPKGYRRSDERIHEEICERLSRPFGRFDAGELSSELDVSDVTVSVAGGQVTLEGTVPERRMKHYIEDLVDACPGVQDIENRIRVRR